MRRSFVLTAALFVSAGLLYSYAPAPHAADFAAARAEWANTLRSKQLDTFVLLYSSDAVFMSTDVGRVTGRDGIRRITQQAMNTFTSDMTFRSVNTDEAASLAYDSGEYSETLTPNSGGASIHAEGNYLTIYKRQSGSRWLIVQQVWTGNPPKLPAAH